MQLGDLDGVPWSHYAHRYVEIAYRQCVSSGPTSNKHAVLWQTTYSRGLQLTLLQDLLDDFVFVAGAKLILQSGFAGGV